MIVQQKSDSLMIGTILVIAGIFLSGPPMVILVDHLKPQPAWTNVETFIANFHRLQTLPYWFGLLLVIGNIVYIISLSRLASIGDSIRSTLAVVSVGIYAGLISLNYIVQAIAMPFMVLHSSDKLDLFCMTNPASLSWCIEMFGYAVLGVAYWLAACAFPGKGIQATVRYLMIFNGIISVLALMVPALDPDLLLQPGGIMGYYFWNALIVVIMVLSIVLIKQGKVYFK